MIELRTLGALEVTSADGTPLRTVLAQPRRLALLSYLALASPHGFHRRDTLFALFWPEHDTEHARHALRQSLYFLRHALGAAAIVARGDEELAVGPDRVRCDVVEFERAIEEGRLEMALALYRGDLLPGFHISDAPEFEIWLEQERARLRDLARDAWWALADIREHNGDAAGAAEAGRRAAALAPADESAIRRLVRTLDRLGARAAAVVAYETFARRLEQEYDLRPSEETRALVAAMRDTAPPDAASPAGVKPRVTPGLEPRDEAGPLAGTASRARAAASRRRPIVTTLLTLGTVTAIAGFMQSDARAPAPSPSPGVIAVLPFAYRGNPELSYLAEGMVDLLSAKLDGGPGVRTVDPHALLTFVNGERSGTDLAAGRRVAEHFGADRFVLGSIVEAGRRLAVSATVYDLGGVPERSMDTSAVGAAEVFAVADRLARHILAEVQDQPLELARVADQGTSSLEALKAYIEGEREFRNGRWSKAADALQRAVQLDSAFALAHYRLSFMGDLVTARQHLDLARRHSAGLSEHQRGLIEATGAFARGDYKLADRMYRQVLSGHPDDLEAWLMLGGLAGSLGPLNGEAWVDARDAFEHVLKLDPRNANALWQLAAYAARDRRLAELDSLTERFLRLHPEPRDSGNVEGQRAVVRGDSAGLERFIADLRGRADLPAQTGAGVVTWTTMDLVAGRRLWHLITEPNRSIGMRVLARATLAKIELTNGRWQAASAQLDSAARLDPGSALEHRAYYALTYFLKVPRAELVALRDSLERWNPARASPAADGPAAMHRSVHRYLKAYLLAMVCARLGEDRAALRYASELERADSSSPAGAFAFDQAKVVRAEVAWRRGRTEEALATLEDAGFWTKSSGLDESGDSPFFIHIHERFARAEMLYATGRVDEAMRWYRVFTYDMVYTAPAHYRLAQIYQARGDQRAASQHYAKFVETWRDCDPMLRAKLQQGAVELARLR